MSKHSLTELGMTSASPYTDTGEPAAGTHTAGPLEMFVGPARYWRLLLIVGLAVGIVSAAISLAIPPRFTASASFIPEGGDQPALSSSSLAALAGQFGISTAALGNTGAQFYNDLIRSRSITRQLLAARVPARGRAVPVIDLLDIHDENAAVRLELAERAIAERIRVNIDRATDRIDLTVWMRDPETAKAVADTILALINRFDREIRHTHASERRAFAERQGKLAADSLRAAEEAMAAFLNQNRSYQESAALTFQHDRLARIISLRQNLYLSLVQEVQQARLQEVDTRPVLTVIDPPVLPGRRTWPKRTLLVLICVLAAESFLWFLLILRDFALPVVRTEDSDLARALGILRATFREMQPRRLQGARERGR